MANPTWDDVHQQRLNALRDREESGVLTSAEQVQLAELLTRLDDLEWLQLQPALACLEQEQAATIAAIARLETRRDELAQVVKRRRQMIARAQAQLRDLLAEHQALQADFRRLNLDVPTV